MKLNVGLDNILFSLFEEYQGWYFQVKINLFALIRFVIGTGYFRLFVF